MAVVDQVVPFSSEDLDQLFIVPVGDSGALKAFIDSMVDKYGRHASDVFYAIAYRRALQRDKALCMWMLNQDEFPFVKHGIADTCDEISGVFEEREFAPLFRILEEMLRLLPARIAKEGDKIDAYTRRRLVSTLCHRGLFESSASLAKMLGVEWDAQLDLIKMTKAYDSGNLELATQLHDGPKGQRLAGVGADPFGFLLGVVQWKGAEIMEWFLQRYGDQIRASLATSPSAPKIAERYLCYGAVAQAMGHDSHSDDSISKLLVLARHSVLSVPKEYVALYCIEHGCVKTLVRIENFHADELFKMPTPEQVKWRLGMSLPLTRQAKTLAWCVERGLLDRLEALVMIRRDELCTIKEQEQKFVKLTSPAKAL